MIFQLVNLKTQLAQKPYKTDLDALQARVNERECWNENKSGMNGPRVDNKGDEFLSSADCHGGNFRKSRY